MEIVDYKTGKPKTETHADKDLQLSVYALAAREELDVKPVRLVYYNLQNNECVSATRDEKQLKEVRGTIQEVAADIRAREFPARPGFICKTCEFRSSVSRAGIGSLRCAIQRRVRKRSPAAAVQEVNSK